MSSIPLRDDIEDLLCDTFDRPSRTNDSAREFSFHGVQLAPVTVPTMDAHEFVHSPKAGVQVVGVYELILK